MIRDRLRLLAVYASLALALASCSTDSVYLPALEADPIASYEAAGIELVEDDRNPEEGPDLIFGKPSRASVRRVYDIVDGAEGESVLSEAVSYAESVGWHMEAESITGSQAFLGWRQMPPGEARVIMAIDVEDVELIIRLDFTEYASE